MNRNPGDWFQAAVFGRRMDNKWRAMAARARRTVKVKRRGREQRYKYRNMDDRRWVKQGTTKRKNGESWKEYGKYFATNVALPAVGNYLLRAALPGASTAHALTAANVVRPYANRAALAAGRYLPSVVRGIGVRAATNLPGTVYNLANKVVSNVH